MGSGHPHQGIPCGCVRPTLPLHPDDCARDVHAVPLRARLRLPIGVHGVLCCRVGYVQLEEPLGLSPIHDLGRYDPVKEA